MKHLRHILIGILLLLTSCIENSIPYPVVTLQILGVEGEGFTCAPEVSIPRNESSHFIWTNKPTSPT